MNGKKTKRLDSAIASLTSLLYDKQFDRLTTICKGKYTKRLSELRKRHTASVNMRSITAEMAPGKELCIRSESEETEYNSLPGAISAVKWPLAKSCAFDRNLRKLSTIQCA